MKPAPQVSIIVTARNASPHLKSAVESVLQQSFQNWELVLFDDGSTDNTADLCRNWAARDARIVAFTSPPVGRACALNAAIRMATAERVMILDADDVFHPEKLARQMESCGRLEPRAIVGCKMKVFRSDAELIWRDAPKDSRVENVTSRLALNNPLGHSSVCFSRELFEKIGGYVTTQSGALDYRLYVDAVGRGATLFEIDQVLAAKRIHRAQWFERRTRWRYLSDGFRTQCRAIKLTRAAWYFRPLAVLRFLYGFLPATIRMARVR